MPTVIQLCKYTALIGLMLSTINVATARDGGPRNGPPEEALQACVELSEGDSCSFEGRRGEAIEGQCIVIKQEDNDGLACKPDSAPERR
ncbi:hypothetical protein [Ferrimonas lipolytica]|uniref:Uncharacterized protein n=1 Tax=Ferrimonas lipolytica TaxID=2724191 RepID=A0A6H1UG72_9GAMM|nr:hypothetical protein [Ferrimonas lipolytica]QIZ77600.1 hypothetical protein HER31_12265 [Ferrimonas lipolytica]